MTDPTTPEQFSSVTEHTHNGTDSKQVSYKDLLDKPATAASPAWVLVSYTTGSSNSFVVSGLNLNADFQYHFVVQCRNITNAGIVYGRCNDDAGANKHVYANQGYHQSGGETNSASNGDTKWAMNMANGGASHHISMFLSILSGMVLGNWLTASVGYSGDDNLRPSTTTGAGHWNDSAAVTSFSFTHNSGDSCDWRVWVFKAALS